LTGLLPFEVWVGWGVGAVPHGHRRRGTRGLVPTVTDGGEVPEIPDLIVTRHPITDRYLQLVHHLSDRPKIFLARHPAQGERGKDTEFVVGAEAGRSVPSHNPCEKIFFPIPVVQPGE